MANEEAFGGTGPITGAIGPDGSAAVRPAHRSVRFTYHGLRQIGLTALEAGNLTAHLNGLSVTDLGWTPDEIERLLFVRALVQRSRIAG